MRKRITIGAVALGMVLSGCGGGGGGGGSAVTTPPVTTPFTTGNFSGRAAATNPPVTTAAQMTVATGLTGTITQLKLRDQNVDLNDTRIAYGTPISGSGDIYFANIDGSNAIRFTKTELNAEENPAISPAGNKIACQEFDNSFSFLRHIVLYRSDGLFLAQVTPNGTATQEADPCWSPDSSKLLFDQLSGTGNHLVQYTVTGGAMTPIDTGGDAFQPAWSSLNKLAFVSVRSGHPAIYVSKADGSSPTLSDFTSDNCDSPAWSPDGSTLYYVDHGSGTNSIVSFHTFFWGSTTSSILTTTDAISSLHATPDGQWVAFQDISTSPPSIQRVPAAGGSASTLFSPPLNTYGFSWGPMVSDRLIIGVGGLLATTASGFIYADASGRTQSVLAFNAVTPSSCILHAMTGIGGTEDSLVFTVDADTLNLMQYANSPSWVAQSVVLSGTSTPTANGAIISIDAFGGQVNAVLPFNGSRAVDSRPKVTRSGSTYVFSGSFLGAFDKSGKNIAPSGASTVRLDPATGALTAS